MEENLKILLDERKRLELRLERIADRLKENLEVAREEYNINISSDKPAALRQRKVLEEIEQAYLKRAEEESKEIQNSIETQNRKIILELRATRDRLLGELNPVQKEANANNKELEEAKQQLKEAEARYNHEKVELYRQGIFIEPDATEVESAREKIEKLRQKGIELEEKTSSKQERIDSISQFFGTIMIKDTSVEEIKNILSGKEIEQEQPKEEEQPVVESEKEQEPQEQPAVEPEKEQEQTIAETIEESKPQEQSGTNSHFWQMVKEYAEKAAALEGIDMYELDEDPKLQEESVAQTIIMPEPNKQIIVEQAEEQPIVKPEEEPKPQEQPVAEPAKETEQQVIDRIQSQNHEAARRAEQNKIKSEEPQEPKKEASEPEPKQQNVVVDAPVTENEEPVEDTDKPLNIVVSRSGIKIGENEISYKDLVIGDQFNGFESIWNRVLNPKNGEKSEYLEFLQDNIEKQKFEHLKSIGDPLILTALVSSAKNKNDFLNKLEKYYKRIGYFPCDKTAACLTYDLKKKLHIKEKMKSWLEEKDVELEYYLAAIKQEAYRARYTAEIKASRFTKLQFRIKEMLERSKQKRLDKAAEKAKNKETIAEKQAAKTAPSKEPQKWGRTLSDEERAKHNAKLEEIRNRAPQEPIKYEPPQNVKPVDKEDLEA